MSFNPLSSIPIVGGLFDNSDDQAMAEIAKNRQLMDAIKTPDLQWVDYAPEQDQSESANYELAKEDPLLRSAQMSALQKMSGLADRGLSEEDAAAFQRARSEGNQMARAGTEAAIQNAQARGVGGSGLEFAMREAANQQGAERAQSAGLDQAANAARQRALYSQAYGNMLGSVRGQDNQASQANADIINRFNMANTQQRNQTGQMNTQLQNQAQLTNNQGKNDIAQQRFQNDMSRATGQMGANTQAANAYAAQNSARTADRNMFTNIAAMGMAGMPAGAAAVAKPKLPNQAGESYKDYSAYA